MREIKFDADQMHNEINHIEEENQIIKQMIEKTFLSLEELDSGWEGKTKEAAQKKFLKDKEILTEISSEVDYLIEAMRETTGDYRKTDDEAKELVQSL